jgi:hypothetical protein
MAHSNKESHEKNSNSETVEVLYQKLGGRWFAFSLVDDEVFVGSVSQEEIDAPDMKRKISGNA